jgi:hypothetical protein
MGNAAQREPETAPPSPAPPSTPQPQPRAETRLRLTVPIQKNSSKRKQPPREAKKAHIRGKRGCVVDIRVNLLRDALDAKGVMRDVLKMAEEIDKAAEEMLDSDDDDDEESDDESDRKDGTQ